MRVIRLSAALLAAIFCCPYGKSSLPRNATPYGVYTNGYISIGATAAGVQRFSFFQDWTDAPRLDVNKYLFSDAPGSDPIYSNIRVWGDAYGFISPQKAGGEAEASANEFSLHLLADSGLVQVRLIEQVHDAIVVKAPAGFGPASRIAFELSIRHEGDNPPGKIWISVLGSQAFAGMNFTVIPTEAGLPLQEGDPLGYSYYKGDPDMATGVGFLPGTLGTTNDKKKFFYMVTPSIGGFDLNIRLDICALAYFSNSNNASQWAVLEMIKPFYISLKAITPGVSFQSRLGCSYSDSALYDPPYDLIWPAAPGS
jgi:hypothetical protein